MGCYVYMYTHFLRSSNSHEQIEGHSSRPFTGNGGNINLSVIHLFFRLCAISRGVLHYTDHRTEKVGSSDTVKIELTSLNYNSC